MQVINLQDRPSLEDIAGRLRWLAGEIEANRIEATAAYVIIPVENDFPIVYGYGDVNGDNHPIIQFECAKALFVNNLMSR